MTDVAVVVPWRDKGNPRRRANLRRVLRELEAAPWPVHVVEDGRPATAPFGRQHAYNRGMRLHPADVWIFCEADMLTPLDQLHRAAEWATDAPGLVVPFSVRHELGAEDSIDVVAGSLPSDYEPARSMPRSFGAVNIVSAETMTAVGRWDENLNGHGYDDTAMREAFRVATGNETRYVDGPAWHLWHPQGYSPWEKSGPHADPANYAPDDVAATETNRRRFLAYRAATTPDEVRDLTSGRR